MSIACELSNPNLKKTKAEISVGKAWVTKILLFRVLCGLVCISALLWLCLSFLCICKKREGESSKGLLFSNQNVSRSEIDAMLTLFFDSNQVTSFECHKESSNPGMWEIYCIACSLSTTRFEKDEEAVAELMSSTEENVVRGGEEEEENEGGGGGGVHQAVFFYGMNIWHWWWLVLCVLVAVGHMIFVCHRGKELSFLLQDKQQQQCKRAGKLRKNMLLLGIIAGVLQDKQQQQQCKRDLSILVSTFHHGKTTSAIDIRKRLVNIQRGLSLKGL